MGWLLGKGKIGFKEGKTSGVMAKSQVDYSQSYFLFPQLTAQW